MSAGREVLRLNCFRAVEASVDSALRDVVVPALAALDGVDVALAARQGSEDGERLLASVWRSREAMAAAWADPGERGLQAIERRPDAREAGTETADLEIVEPWSGQGEPHILRLVIGRVLPDRFAEYVERARTGVGEDAALGRGPLAFYLGDLGEDRFVTLSMWGQWSKVAEATGGSLREPMATRHRDLLVAWDIQHYEVLATARRSPGGASSRRGVAEA